MSRRFRTAELLAAAGLAPAELARERQRGENDAQNTQAWANALGGAAKGVWGILGPGGAIEKNATDTAQLAADQAVADNASETGTRLEGPSNYGEGQLYGDTATDVAQKATGPLSALGNDSWNPYAKSAATKAKVSAQKGVTTEVQANRDKAQKEEIARQAATTTEADKQALRDLEQKKIDAKAKPKASDDGVPSGVDMDVAFNKIAGFEPGTSPAAKALDAGEQTAALKDAEIKKANAEAVLANRTASQGKPLDAMQIADFSSLDEALNQAKQIAADKGTIDTGPISSIRNLLAQKMGVDDPKVTEFKARVGSQLADYIRSISGGAVAEGERAALLQNVPDASDDDTAFMAKMSFVIKKLEAKRAIMLKNAKAGHVDVSGLAPAPSGSTIAPRGTETPASSDIPKPKLGW